MSDTDRPFCKFLKSSEFVATQSLNWAKFPACMSCVTNRKESNWTSLVIMNILSRWTMHRSIGIKISQSSIPLHLCDRLTADILHPEIRGDCEFFVRSNRMTNRRCKKGILIYFAMPRKFPHSPADRWHFTYWIIASCWSSSSESRIGEACVPLCQRCYVIWCLRRYVNFLQPRWWLGTPQNRFPQSLSSAVRNLR